MRLFLPMTRYPEVEQRAEIHQRFEDRLAGIAEIESSTLTSSPPLQGGYQRLLQIDGQPWPGDRRPPTVTMVSVTDGYFDTLGIEVLRGRAFGRTDGLAGQSTAVVNQRFATLYFGDEDPLGRRILLEAESPQGRRAGAGVGHDRRAHAEHPAARVPGARAGPRGLPAPPRGGAHLQPARGQDAGRPDGGQRPGAGSDAGDRAGPAALRRRDRWTGCWRSSAGCSRSSGRCSGRSPSSPSCSRRWGSTP